MLKSTPIVGAERLCFEYNTVDGVCTISDKHLHFEENFIYVTDKQLVFNSAPIVECIAFIFVHLLFLIMLIIHGV